MKQSIKETIKSQLNHTNLNEMALQKIVKQLEEEFAYYQFEPKDIKVEEYFGEEYAVWVFVNKRDWSFDEQGTCTGSGGWFA